jgi:hypothetical protein
MNYEKPTVVTGLIRNSQRSTNVLHCGNPTGDTGNLDRVEAVTKRIKLLVILA